MRKFVYLFFAFYAAFFSLSLQAGRTGLGSVATNTSVSGGGDLYFIENKGQWDAEVLFLARMKGMDAWITRKGLNFNFYKAVRTKNTTDFTLNEADNLDVHRVAMEYKESNPAPGGKGLTKKNGYISYFKGNDHGKHIPFVEIFEDVLIQNIYEGIDIRYYFDRGFLRYDFIVNPGADPGKIKFGFKGHFGEVMKGKDIIYLTKFGEVVVGDLYTYQIGLGEIPSRFEKNGDLYKISLGHYDKDKPLVIDPLIYSTFIGGGSDDYAYAIAKDAAGNVYITGKTNSADYDHTLGAYQSTHASYDVFISKLNAAGNTLSYSAIIGGGNDDIGNDITVDDNGNAYVVGYSNSTNYPTVLDYNLSNTNQGGYDVVLTKLNSSGSSLLYSTYIGGTANDFGRAIAVVQGKAYITGNTLSNNFPANSAYQNVSGGSSDIFVTCINANGNAYIYSTYLGGTGFEQGHDIFVDQNGISYITGTTNSGNFPVTAGSFDNTFNGGGNDIFLSKLSSSGNQLVYSTFFGSTGDDYGRGIACTFTSLAGPPPLVIENIYISGYTNSSAFPVTSGAFQTNYGGGNYDAVILKFNLTSNSLVYASYLGGSGNDYGFGIAVANNSAHITGYTESTDFPVFPGAFQTALNGSTDAFVAKFGTAGADVTYSSYLGGSQDDYSYGIQADTSGNVYITGHTSSGDFPAISAYQSAKDGANDVFVSKLCMAGGFLSSGAQTDQQTVCLGTAAANIIYNFSGVSGANVSGLPNGMSGSFSGGVFTISGTPTETGTFNYTVSGVSNCGFVIQNGTVTVEICQASVNELQNAVTFAVFPNPNEGRFNLKTQKGGMFEMLDLTGRLLNAYSVQGGEVMIFENIPSGLYFIREVATGSIKKVLVK